MQLALKEMGVQHESLALTRAVAIALGEPDAFERWIGGQAIFAQFSDDTDEERSLDHLARQVRRQVQGEAQALQRILSSLTERPGAWTTYTVSGTMPAIDTTPRHGTLQR